MDKIVYCLLGVEYNMSNTPGNIHVLGVFTNIDLALKAREKSYQNITLVDIVETTIDKINNNIEDRCLNVS